MWETIGIWVEAIALVAIFIWDRRDANEQQKEMIKQLDVMRKQAETMQLQAAAAQDNAAAAKVSAQSVLNSERAWVEIQLRPPFLPDYQDEAQRISSDLFECSIEIVNQGKTIAYIESVEVGTDCVSEPLPKEPLKLHTSYFRSLLGSGQSQRVEQFYADSAFSDGESIVNGTKRGILRIIVKYKDIIDDSILHQTLAVYVFQDSLEDEPQRVSSLSDYT